MPTQISEEEARALVQVLDNYEHIVRNQPDDYQTLEALKETYLRLDRREDALRASRMLVNAYCANGQFSLALMECEGILRQEPGSREVMDVMAELQKRAGGRLPETGGNVTPDPDGGLIERQRRIVDHASNNGSATTSGLIATKSTHGANSTNRRFDLGSQGNEALAAYLSNQGLAPRAVVQQALDSLAGKVSANAPSPSLLLEVCRLGNLSMENLLSDLVDRTGFAYIPVENYDVDRNIVQLLPDDLTLGRLLLPFDQIGRVMYIATCNPFDVEARERAMQSIECHFDWFLAAPDALQNKLAQVFRLPQPNP